MKTEVIDVEKLIAWCECENQNQLEWVYGNHILCSKCTGRKKDERIKNNI